MPCPIFCRNSSSALILAIPRANQKQPIAFASSQLSGSHPDSRQSSGIGMPDFSVPRMVEMSLGPSNPPGGELVGPTSSQNMERPADYEEA
jgi:hypothetical protein